MLKVTFVDQREEEDAPLEVPNYVTDASVRKRARKGSERGRARHKGENFLVRRRSLQSISRFPSFNSGPLTLFGWQKMVIDPLNPPLITPVDGYRTEFGSSQFNIENRQLYEVEKHSALYKHVFEGRRTSPLFLFPSP